MFKPLVSIIIPVYNGENYLKDAIESALAQTYEYCEIIVVNDGSSDNTQSIALHYSNKIRCFYKENGGVSSALNLGLQKMHGEYFTWLAHDDVFYADKIERQIAALERSTDKTAIVHGNYDLLDMKYNTTSFMRQEESYTPLQLTNAVFPVLMTSIHASTPLIHKSHIERVGNFDEKLTLTQDYDFLFRAMRGQQSIFIPEPLLLSRLHSESGKNTNDRFGSACTEQYKHFADILTFDEVISMFVSPRAFYLRIVAMMKARHDTVDSDKLYAQIDKLPRETRTAKLSVIWYIIKGSKGCRNQL